MDSVEHKLDLGAIAREISQIQFKTDDSGARMAIGPCQGVPEWLRKYPNIIDALDDIIWIREQRVLHVMINKLPPGVVVHSHTDTLAPTSLQGPAPRVERWHLPITTNEHCLFWDSNFGYTRMMTGRWWGPAPYWLPHAVENTGKTERVHIVVDLDTPERIQDVAISKARDPRDPEAYRVTRTS